MLNFDYKLVWSGEIAAGAGIFHGIAAAAGAAHDIVLAALRALKGYGAAVINRPFLAGIAGFGVHGASLN